MQDQVLESDTNTSSYQGHDHFAALTQDPSYPQYHPSPPHHSDQTSHLYPSSHSSQPIQLSPASFVCVPSTILLKVEVSESPVNYLQEVVNDEHKESNALTPGLTEEVSECPVYYLQEVVDDEEHKEPSSSPPLLTKEVSESPVYYYVQEVVDNEDTTYQLNKKVSESQVFYVQEMVDCEAIPTSISVSPPHIEEVSESSVSYVQEVVHDENTDEAIVTSVSSPHIEEVSEYTFYFVEEWPFDENSDTTEPIQIATTDSSTPPVIEEVSYYYEDNYDSIQTSNSFDDFETTRDYSKPRNIYVTVENYQYHIEMLSAELLHLRSNQSDSKLEIVLNLQSRTLRNSGTEQRQDIIQRFLNLFGKYIIGISLVIFNDDVYLLEQQYYFPKLRYLTVNRHLAARPYKPRINDDFDYSTRILEDLLIIYGNCLKVLEVTGVWNLEISDTKPIPVPALETLHLNRSMSCTLHRLIIISGNYITTLELTDIKGQKASGHDCYLTNLKHLRIHCNYSLKYFEFVRCNAERLESLMISCGLCEEDFYPRNLFEFRNLKLLEVNFPLLGTAILLRSSLTLEYLYVPEWKEPLEDLNWRLESYMNMPVYLPRLKDLCVLGNKRWSIDVIKNNWRSLEFLVIFGYNEHIGLLGDDDDSSDESNSSDHFDDDGNYTGEDKCIWQDLANIDCHFPSLKMLLLPDCPDTTIVENLHSKCPANVQVITDNVQCGEAVKARIQQAYTYKRYTRLMHSQLSLLFDLEDEPSLEEYKDEIDDANATEDSDYTDDSEDYEDESYSSEDF